MFDKVSSINQSEEISIKADRKVFNLYASTTEKNGILVAFNELKSFVVHLEEERNLALDKVKENDKWFKKGIEFLDEWKRPYKVGEATEADKQKIKELKEEYPRISFENIHGTHTKMKYLQFANMQHYIDSNREFFNKIDTIDINEQASGLYVAITRLDYLNVLFERTKDLIQLLVEDRFSKNIEKKDFVRTHKEIKRENRKKPGPKIPEKLKDDIDSILDEIVQEPEFLNSNGELVIKRAIEDYAFEHPMFVKNWVNEETAIKPGGYSKRRLHDLFSKRYEKMNS